MSPWRMILFIMVFIEKELAEKADICNVCGVPLKDVKNVITEEIQRDVLTFCSEKCRKEYLQDPQKYTEQEEVLE